MTEERVDALHVLDVLPDAVVVLEAGPTVVWVNASAARLLGRPRGECLGPCTDVLPIADLDGQPLCASSPIGRRVSLSRGLPEREYQLRRVGGEFIPITMRCAYEKDTDDVVLRIVCTMRDARARRGMDLRTVELISTVSHEIRSPLTSVKGFTKMLLDRWDRFDDDMKIEMLRSVDSDADRVTRLLTELLDVSRLEAGRLRLRPALVDLRELADKVCGKLQPRTERHTIQTRFSKSVPRVLADPDKVEQVLTNLVENAIKYTAEGTITVAVRPAKSMVSVSVSDEGEGIPESHVGRLFRKFFSRERAGSPSGTGLGLYICKGLIEAHGGTLTASSQQGKGTVFTFHLPRRQPGAVP